MPIAHASRELWLRLKPEKKDRRRGHRDAYTPTGCFNCPYEDCRWYPPGGLKCEYLKEAEPDRCHSERREESCAQDGN